MVFADKQKKKKLLPLILASITIFGAFSAYTKLVYQLGLSNASRKTAIELLKKFDFQAKNLNEKEINLVDQTIELHKIYLAEFTEPLPDDENMMVYIVRQLVNSPQKTQEIGSITTEKKQINQNEYWGNFLESIQKVLSLSSSNFVFIEQAHAQEAFEWHGYENNYDFYERYIDESTIRRLYDDGAILEYKVDSEGTSISESFKWIKLPRRG